MTSPFDPAALRAFRRRDWASVRRAKEQYWAEDHAARGPLAGLRAGAALWDQARAIDPSWPDEAQRAEDLAHHVDLVHKLRRLDHVFRR
ncbi:MAG: hypothetical protein R3B40_03100 [Polyangiales bacterium]|nr:hypothetical protein [Myxococcales bacterium]